MSKGGGILVAQQNGANSPSKQRPAAAANQLPSAAAVEGKPKANRANRATAASTAKSVSPAPNRQNSQRRHGSAKQLYRRYVNKSNLFAESPASNNGTTLGGGARWQIGRAPNGAPFRMSDSMPSPNQLEWQKQRRAHTRQLAMNAPGSLNGPKIVQKHAEMRSYLLHCQRVLNARARVDTGRPTGRSAASSSSHTSPSVASSLGGEYVGPTATLRQNRARSVPANAANRRRRELTAIERELQDENRRLLERLVQISISGGHGAGDFTSSTSFSQLQSRQSTGVSGQNHRPIRNLSGSRRKGNDEDEIGENGI